MMEHNHTGQEHDADLARLHKESDEIRKMAFWAMKNCLRATEQDLKNSGYKTQADAVVGHFKYAQERIDKLTKEYLKKYPD